MDCSKQKKIVEIKFYNKNVKVDGQHSTCLVLSLRFSLTSGKCTLITFYAGVRTFQREIMAPGTHLLISWLSSVELLKNRRERTLVTLSGIAPDLDGLGIVVDWVTGTTELYSKYHHYLGHSFMSAVVLSLLSSILAKVQRIRVFFLTFFVVHVHIFCDVIGSKGPDGYQWPIYYLYPFNNDFELVWLGQWELNAWQNQVILLLLISFCLFYAATRKMSFFEVIHPRLDKEAFDMYDRYIRKKA